MTTAKPRRGRPRDASLRARRRSEILVEAARLFARRGYPNTDLEMVARRLGVAKGTIYHYFRTKRTLFFAAVDDGMRRLGEVIDAAVADRDDPLERLAHGAYAYLKFFDDHPEIVELLVQERAEFKDRRRSSYFEHQDAYLEPWRRLHSSMIETGRFRSMPVERIVAVFSDQVYGAMFTHYFTGSTRSIAAQLEDILDVLLGGILSDEERKRQGTDFAARLVGSVLSQSASPTSPVKQNRASRRKAN